MEEVNKNEFIRHWIDNQNQPSLPSATATSVAPSDSIRQSKEVILNRVLSASGVRASFGSNPAKTQHRAAESVMESASFRGSLFSQGGRKRPDSRCGSAAAKGSQPANNQQHHCGHRPHRPGYLGLTHKLKAAVEEAQKVGTSLLEYETAAMIGPVGITAAPAYINANADAGQADEAIALGPRKTDHPQNAPVIEPVAAPAPASSSTETSPPKPVNPNPDAANEAEENKPMGDDADTLVMSSASGLQQHLRHQQLCQEIPISRILFGRFSRARPSSAMSSTRGLYGPGSLPGIPGFSLGELKKGRGGGAM